MSTNAQNSTARKDMMKRAKANAEKLNLSVSEISTLSDEKLAELLATLEPESTEGAVSNETTSSAIADGMDTDIVIAKSGEQVPVIKARFVEKTTASALFETSDGKKLYCNNPRLAVAIGAGRVSAGDVFGFKPDTLVWNEARGVFYGDLNQAYNAELFEKFNAHTENVRSHFTDRVNQLIVEGGYTPSEARAKAQAERDTSMPPAKPLPTLSL